ncbi:carbohydrate esterase family 4 protein [Sphaerobolus stellatus SS14]|nr:carbohydrate esterase family 4 protein [Sphaerobolus stellatus SS14]
MATVALATTATLGQAGPFPGFPNLPTSAYKSTFCGPITNTHPATLTQSLYPTPTGTVVPWVAADVEEWLKELEGHNIPDIPPTVNDALCGSNAAAVADTSRCWWTCGGCTRPTDIFTCPDKGTWGLTFDDGPSPNTPRLLEYLKDNNLKSTFAVVGGSNYFFPDILRTEYVSGHHIIVHTYRHPYMTTLTTPEVVAELGYTRKIIKDTIGVTPAYWRPPYGDVDDRIRAIAFAMGLETIIWTRNPSTLDQFDTNDWRIPAGQVTGPQAFQQFENILTNASLLNTGFIVLEHDLYQQTVDLAVGYTLPTALNHNPKFNIIPVIDCIKLDVKEAYIETMTNKSRTAPATTWTGSFIKDPTALLNGNETSAANGTTGSSGGSGASGANGASGVSPDSSGSGGSSVSSAKTLFFSSSWHTLLFEWMGEVTVC